MKALIRKVKFIYKAKKEKFERRLYNRLRCKYEISYDNVPVVVASPVKLKDFHILRIGTLKSLPRESLNVNDRRFIDFITMKNFQLGSVMEKSDLNTLNTVYRKHCNEKSEYVEPVIIKVDEPESEPVQINGDDTPQRKLRMK